MKTLLIPLCLVSMTLQADDFAPPSTFEILPNEIRVINSADQLPNAVDYFIMNKNSQLIINPSLNLWELTARKAYFAEGAKIIGTGKSYNQSAAWGSTGGNGGNCHTGHAGSDGASGDSGTKGLDIKLQLGVVSFGDLTIDVSGGNGQSGGNGGNGGNGGRADISEYCKGGVGGRGGRGGNAGSGGSGGNVNITWWEVGNLKNISQENNSLKGLKIVSSNGNSGLAGKPGLGGNGGPGRCKQVAFAKTCRGPGSVGESGSSGYAAGNGEPGKIQIIHTPK